MRPGRRPSCWASPRRRSSPGRYGLWIDNGFGHARVGDVVRIDPASGTVERELLGVDRGHLAPGGARWNPYYYSAPPDESRDLPTEHVTYAGDLGPMPAWVVPRPRGRGSAGRCSCTGAAPGARRRSGPCHRCSARGWTCLVPSYRNDEGVPPGPDGRYALGLSEWRDVEAAIRYAVDRGAREVLLMGWSMGGAIVLQLLDRSPLSALVSRVVLDAPVIDWGDVLAHHARAHRVPPHVGSLARVLMRHRWGHRLVGVHEGVDLAKTDWVRRGDELHHPVLLIHSGRRRVRALRPVTRAGAGAARPGHLRGVAPSPGTARSGTPTPSAGSASSATSPPADGADAVRGGGPARGRAACPPPRRAAAAPGRMPSGATQRRSARDPGAVATDDRGHERQRQLVDDPGGEGRSEQRRPALAEHVPQTARGQGVERGRQVDVVTPGDDDGILTEAWRARSSARGPGRGAGHEQPGAAPRVGVRSPSGTRPEPLTTTSVGGSARRRRSA